MKGDFRVSEEIFGTGYDYIILSHYLEHLEDPVKWIKKIFHKTNKIICILPNNFYKIGEHVNMKWSNWKTFYSLFKEFKIKRIDEGKYSSNLIGAYRNPIFIFEKKKNKKSKAEEVSKEYNKEQKELVDGFDSYN
jgi:hypothetical protein